LIENAVQMLEIADIAATNCHFSFPVVRVRSTIDPATAKG
jgi:hypothetical protein